MDSIYFFVTDVFRRGFSGRFGVVQVACENDLKNDVIVCKVTGRAVLSRVCFPWLPFRHSF